MTLLLKSFLKYSSVSPFKKDIPYFACDSLFNFYVLIYIITQKYIVMGNNVFKKKAFLCPLKIDFYTEKDIRQRQ